MKFERWFQLSKEEIEQELANVEPKIHSSRQKYFVHIKGRDYPINQVVSTICKLSPLEVATVQAYNLVKKKGFEIKERSIKIGG